MGDLLKGMYDYQVRYGITTLSYDRWLDFTKEDYRILREVLTKTKLIQSDELVVELLCSKDLSIVEGVERHLFNYRDYEGKSPSYPGEEYEGIPLDKLTTANFVRTGKSNAHVVVSSTLFFNDAICLLDEGRIARLTFALVEDDTYTGFRIDDLNQVLQRNVYPYDLELQGFNEPIDGKTYGIYSYTKRR